jgi:hypothetical protein
MIKQDKNGIYLMDISVQQAESAKNLAKNIELVKEFGKVTDMLYQYGRKVEETTRKNLGIYFNDVKKKAIELKDDEKILDFLINEKSKINSKLIEANIAKDANNRAYFKSLLTTIIDPKIEEFQAKLLLKKIIPGLKDIKSPEKSLQDKVERNETQPDKLISTSTIENKKTSASSEDIYTELPEEFTQIVCKASTAEITDYFMRLANKKNEIDGMPYMDEENVIKLLKKNFRIFNTNPIGQYFPINLTVRQKGRLRYFMYVFYSKYSFDPQEKDVYAYFLIHNFDLFKNDSLKTLKSNMSASKSPHVHII